jgi:hypothetical protein
MCRNWLGWGDILKEAVGAILNIQKKTCSNSLQIFKKNHLAITMKIIFKHFFFFLKNKIFDEN